MNRPLRLLLVTDSYPPFVGGADADTEALGKAMARLGHAVMVATPWQPGLALEETSAEVLVHRIRPLSTRMAWFARDARRRHHPPFPDPGTVFGLRRLIRRHRPDVVHSYGWITSSTALAMVGTGIPLLVSARDFGQICPVRTLAYHRGGICSGPGLAKCMGCAGRTHVADEAGASVLGGAVPRVNAPQRFRGAAKAVVAVLSVHAGMRLLPPRTTAIHSVSTFVTDMVGREFRSLPIGPVPTPPIITIPPFLRAASSDREEEGRSGPTVGAVQLPDRPFILFVGSLLPNKGVWTLLEAYGRLSQPPPLVLLGPRHHNSPTVLPPGVLAPGQATGAEVLAAWDAALFGVVPSVGAETFGNVAVEAMARSRAVIASDVGGLRDIVQHGVTGYLLPPGDVAALADAMRRLIADPSLAQRLGAAGSERVARFSAATVVPRYEALYRQVAERGMVPASEPDATRA